MLNAPGRIGQQLGRRPAWWDGKATAGQNATRKALREQILAHGQAIPATLGSAIAITSSSSATLGGSTIARTDSKIRHYGGTYAQAPGSFPYTLFHQVASRAQSNGVLGGFGATHTFKLVNCDEFEVRCFNAGTRADMYIMVDGAFAAEWWDAPNDGDVPYIKVDLGLGAGNYNIRLVVSDLGWLAGLVLPSGGSIELSDETNDLTLGVFGDSFIEHIQDGFVQRMGYRLGAIGTVQSGFGSTGYNRSFDLGGGVSRPSFKDRLTDFTTLAPCDVYWIAGPMNDAAISSELIAAFETVVDGIRTARPNALINCVSCWNPSAPGGELTDSPAKDDALAAICATRPGVRFIDVSGVAFTKSDAVHPDGPGYVTIGDFLAAEQIADLGLTPLF